MEPIKISSAQFENKSGDKKYNLEIMDQLSATAAANGSNVICFHECSITGYTFARHLTRDQLYEIAEIIPEGESIQELKNIASRNKIIILAGLFEKDYEGNIFKAYVCVDKNGLIAKHRKLHPFINPHIKPGNAFTVFEIAGWKCGILICYDNNIIENVRATVLLGADILFMPHVTMCTPSTRPGAGFVDPALWINREADPTSLRQEFNGLKGRAWLMKWLPARAYDNGVYVVFSNPIGMDDDQLKNGCSMILDPFGDILDECTELGNGIAAATCIPEKLTDAGGFRYRKARRPDLYGPVLSTPHTPEQKVIWL
jgi:predicted amidohydrolase